MSGISPPSAPYSSYTPSDFNTATPQGVAKGISTDQISGTTNIDKLATDFEAVFLSQMMGAMFSGDEITAYFGGGTAGEIYKSFLMDQYGKAMAQAGGIGIATEVKKELLSLQEVS